MKKRLVLAICTGAAVFTAVLTGTATTALPDSATTRIMADGRLPLPAASSSTLSSGPNRPKPPTDTSWGG
ncbi:hypothetical protein [Streptomyces turgidiscabies]|uniref:Uncharacterized protein n=1 Tax=Streptomyces turgidiscabies TaxID=85558 RepID=A0ABU0RZT9_9ACTN|nr:hypothetical protein [Streptomyces turgidiscabies]MDQ0937475.1 hypothetical protein [Streptomyces turgidiscabies]